MKRFSRTAWALAALGTVACTARAPTWSTTPVKPSTSTASTPASDERAQLEREAEAAFAKRDDETEARRAVELYRKIVTIDSQDPESFLSLSRALYFLADGHERFHGDDAEREMLATFEESVTAAEQGLAALSESFAQKMREGAKIEVAAEVLDRRAVPLLYFRAAALGQWATLKGFATLLSYKDEIKRVMEVCLAKDPGYFYAGPDRYFGVFYARAPAFAGGDLATSRQHFERSLADGPEYLGTRVLMAEELAVKARDRTLFKQQLEQVLKADAASSPEIAPENRVEQRKAQALLEREQELFD